MSISQQWQHHLPMKRHIIVALVASLLYGTAAADPQPYMVKENPNELAVIVAVDEQSRQSSRR